MLPHDETMVSRAEHRAPPRWKESEMARTTKAAQAAQATPVAKVTKGAKEALPAVWQKRVDEIKAEFREADDRKALATFHAATLLLDMRKAGRPEAEKPGDYAALFGKARTTGKLYFRLASAVEKGITPETDATLWADLVQKANDGRVGPVLDNPRTKVSGVKKAMADVKAGNGSARGATSAKKRAEQQSSKSALQVDRITLGNIAEHVETLMAQVARFADTMHPDSLSRCEEALTAALDLIHAEQEKPAKEREKARQARLAS